MEFSATISAALEQRAISADLLVHMDFRDAPRRWWTGWGNLEAGGHTWQGLGQLVSIEGLQSAIGTVAPETTFTLSGVDAEIVSIAVDNADRVSNRRARVLAQFFEVQPSLAGSEVMGRLDEPFVLWSGRMEKLRFVGDSALHQVSLSAESLWTRRDRPPHGLYTDRDQRARSPDDRGLEFVARLADKTVTWPKT